MHQIVRLPAEDLLGTVADQFTGSAIDERAVSLQINPVNALPGKFEEQLHLLRDTVSLLLQPLVRLQRSCDVTDLGAILLKTDLDTRLSGEKVAQATSQGNQRGHHLRTVKDERTPDSQSIEDSGNDCEVDSPLGRALFGEGLVSETLVQPAAEFIKGIHDRGFRLEVFLAVHISHRLGEILVFGGFERLLLLDDERIGISLGAGDQFVLLLGQAKRLQAFYSAVAAALDTNLPPEHVAVPGITRDRESPHRRRQLVGARSELDAQQQRLRPGVQCSYLAMSEIPRHEYACHGRQRKRCDQYRDDSVGSLKTHYPSLRSAMVQRPTD